MALQLFNSMTTMSEILSIRSGKTTEDDKVEIAGLDAQSLVGVNKKMCKQKLRRIRKF